jgi:hypothetical protein
MHRTYLFNTEAGKLRAACHDCSWCVEYDGLGERGEFLPWTDESGVPHPFGRKTIAHAPDSVGHYIGPELYRPKVAIGIGTID